MLIAFVLLGTGLAAATALGHRPARSSAPGPSHHLPHALLTERGSGPSAARSFSTTRRRWAVTYSYRCAATVRSNTYSTLPATPATSSFRLSFTNSVTARATPVVSSAAPSGSATTVLTGPGTYVVTVAATPNCRWSVSVHP